MLVAAGRVARRVPALGRRVSTSSANTLAQQVASADEATQMAVLEALPLQAKKEASLKFIDELEEEFSRADLNTDGTLSFKEFQAWAKETVERKGMPQKDQAPPTSQQLRALALRDSAATRTRDAAC